MKTPMALTLLSLEVSSSHSFNETKMMTFFTKTTRQKFKRSQCSCPLKLPLPFFSLEDLQSLRRISHVGNLFLSLEWVGRTKRMIVGLTKGKPGRIELLLLDTPEKQTLGGKNLFTLKDSAGIETRGCKPAVNKYLLDIRQWGSIPVFQGK